MVARLELVPINAWLHEIQVLCPYIDQDVPMLACWADEVQAAIIYSWIDVREGQVSLA